MDKAKKRILGIGVIAVITFAFAFAASGSGVIEQNAEGNGGVTVAASAVTSSINYQGRLTDNAGEPLSGTYTMTFRLYNVSSGGTALATDTNTVEVTDGLFNTGIEFDQSHFDGGELWLGVAVGTDSEMTLRQELRPVPYALSLVPGADIIGSARVALHAETTHWYGSGIRGYASATSGSNRGVTGVSMSPDGHGGYFYNNGGGIGVYGKGGKYGGYFTTNLAGTSGNHNAGVNVTTAYDYSNGVRVSTSGGNSDGVRVDTSGGNSDGVRVDTSGGNSDGVYALTSGINSPGVYARTTGMGSPGVHVSTSGNYSYGVFASSAKSHGVYGKGKYGGYFTTNQGGTLNDHNAGVNVLTAYDYSDGVRASTSGDGSHGVRVDTTGDNSYGVYARTTGDCSHGVRAYTTGDNSHGVRAHTIGLGSVGVRVDTTGDNSRGVYAYTTGDNSRGVYAYIGGTNSTGVYARSTNHHGVYGRTDSADSAGVYARGKDSGADLILGGNAVGGAGDDGKIYSDPKYPSSDIFLITNDCIQIELDNDGDGEDADFKILDKDNKLIFNVDESGDVSYGGPNIAAFPRPAYDSGWVSIGHGVKTLTHNLGGNPDNYVVDLQFYDSSDGRHQRHYGGNSYDVGVNYGAYWKGLDDTRIKVRRHDNDGTTEKIRVRIWVYK